MVQRLSSGYEFINVLRRDIHSFKDCRLSYNALAMYNYTCTFLELVYQGINSFTRSTEM